MKWISGTSYACAIAACVMLAGCGDAVFEMAPVTGTVKFADGTVPKGDMVTIRFEPDGIAPIDNKYAQPATCDLAADGSFTLKSNAVDGAAVGKYKVKLTVVEQYPSPPTEYDLGPAEVKSGSNQFDLKVVKADGKRAGQ